VGKYGSFELDVQLNKPVEPAFNTPEKTGRLSRTLSESASPRVADTQVNAETADWNEKRRTLKRMIFDS